MLRYRPGSNRAGATSYAWSKSSAVSPKLYPALNAARLAARTVSRLAYFSSIHLTVGSVGRVYIQDRRPRAKKFLDRSASRGLTPRGLVASRVIDVMGTWMTRKAASEPSSRGLAW